MFEDAGKYFFETLTEIAKSMLGEEHPCSKAVACAAKSGHLDDIEAAQQCLAELSPERIERLMGAVHKAMREDPGALLGNWHASGGNGRSH